MREEGRRDGRGAARGHDVDDDGNDLHEQRHRAPARVAQLRRHRAGQSGRLTDNGRHAGALDRALDLRLDLGREPVDHRRRQHDERPEGRSGQGDQQRVRPGGRSQDGRLPGGVRPGARRHHQRHHEVRRQRVSRRRVRLLRLVDALQAERVFVPGVDSDLTRHASRGLLANRLRRGPRRVRLQGPALVLRRVRPGELSRRRSRATSRAISCPTRMEFPLDGTDNLYSGQADLEHRRELDARRHGLRRSDDELRARSLADPRLGGVRPITNPDPGTWESTRTIGAIDYRPAPQPALRILGPAHASGRPSPGPVQPGADRGRACRCASRTATCRRSGTPDQPCDAPQEAELRRRTAWLHLRPRRTTASRTGTSFGRMGPLSGPRTSSSSAPTIRTAETNALTLLLRRARG